MGETRVVSVIPMSDPLYVDGMPCVSCGRRTTRTYYSDAVVDSVRSAIAFDICAGGPHDHAAPVSAQENTNDS